MRVWLMEQDAPGLAMSRSLGDYIAHSVGVATDPEIMRFELQPEDKFIIIASDGVWEFLTNEMIAKIVSNLHFLVLVKFFQYRGNEIYTSRNCIAITMEIINN